MGEIAVSDTEKRSDIMAGKKNLEKVRDALSPIWATMPATQKDIMDIYAIFETLRDTIDPLIARIEYLEGAISRKPTKEFKVNE